MDDVPRLQGYPIDRAVLRRRAAERAARAARRADEASRRRRARFAWTL